MSIILTRLPRRKQKAVYWSAPVPDGYSGFTWTAPIELSCRWDDEQKIFIDMAGEEVLSESIVYPDRELDLDGFLWEGTLLALNTAYADVSDPRATANARIIRGLAKIANPRGSKFLLINYLKRA